MQSNKTDSSLLLINDAQRENELIVLFEFKKVYVIFVFTKKPEKEIHM